MSDQTILAKTVASSLEAMLDVQKTQQESVRDHAVSLAVMQSELKTLKEGHRDHTASLQTIIITLDGNAAAGVPGLKTVVATLQQSVEAATTAVGAAKASADAAKDAATETKQVVELLRLDQATGKAFIEGWWKWAIIVSPGVIALVIQALKMFSEK